MSHAESLGEAGSLGKTGCMSHAGSLGEAGSLGKTGCMSHAGSLGEAGCFGKTGCMSHAESLGEAGGVTCGRGGTRSLQYARGLCCTRIRRRYGRYQ
jgi:hypothetical protein